MQCRYAALVAAYSLLLSHQVLSQDQFRITDMGPAGSGSYDALESDIAYNTEDNTYLVVWTGVDTVCGRQRSEYEIYGQILAADGSELFENDFKISDMGPDGDRDFDARDPAVAYNPMTNSFLVVWAGNDTTNGVKDESEIYGQFVSTNGGQIGVNDFRISDAGTDVEGDNYDALDPNLAYNSTDNNFLVVWRGDDTTGGLMDNDNEIFGQIVTADGSELGPNDFRISNTGPDTTTAFSAFAPDVAYNTTDNNFLVIWHGNEDYGLATGRENEIHGQLVSNLGIEIGGDFRISEMGPDLDPDYFTTQGSVAYNSTDNNYLVVWMAADDQDGVVAGEYEIFGQLTSNTGSVVKDDFRISDVSGDGATAYDAFTPWVAYNSADNEFLVVWRADDTLGGLDNDEEEIYGQIISNIGDEEGINDFRISEMGPDGDNDYDADAARIAYNSKDNTFLVIWEADDDMDDLVAGEKEIFGKFIPRCSGSPNNLQIPAIVTEGIFQADDISFDGIIGAPGSVIFEATNFIEFLPPFEVQTTAEFDVVLRACFD